MIAITYFSLIILSLFISLLFQQGILALPPVNNTAITVSIVDEFTNPESYTISDNVKVEKIRPGQSIGYNSNQLYSFNKHFTAVEITKTFHSPNIIYIDGDSVEYDQLPRANDDRLLQIEDDFFTKIPQLGFISYRLFYDNDTIFIAGYLDHGFGKSSIEIYAYNISSQNLQYVGTLPNESNDDMYDFRSIIQIRFTNRE